MIAEDDRRLDRRHQPLGKRVGHRVVLQSVQQDREFVVADTGQDHRWAELLLEVARNGFQRTRPKDLAERIPQVLETIEVQQNARGTAIPVRRRRRQDQAGACRQASELVALAAVQERSHPRTPESCGPHFADRTGDGSSCLLRSTRPTFIGHHSRPLFDHTQFGFDRIDAPKSEPLMLMKAKFINHKFNITENISRLFTARKF